jgi:hypothetical protein
MSALEGFITGFAGKLAEDVTKRKEEARDYFNKQVEYARTTGLENRRRVRQTVDANLGIAQQLEAAGVPRELIMAQVNMNPAGLGDFYNTAEKIRAEKEARYQRPLTADEWNSIFKVSGDFKAPDEDLATFITRTYDPITSAIQSPTFEDDPEGSLFASMLGLNAMDRARARLGETVVAEGMTADQLIRMGDAQPQRIGGNASVTVDYSALGDEEGLDTREVQLLDGVITEELDAEINAATQRGELSVTEGADATKVRQTVIDNVTSIYTDVSPVEIERLVDARLRRMGFTFDGALEEEDATGGPESDVEAPPATPEGVGGPEPQTPSTEAPTTSNEPLSPEERMAAEVAYGFTGIVDNGDGTILVTLPDGTARRYKVSDVRELLRRFETQ